jgi:hypothetical protein
MKNHSGAASEKRFSGSVQDETHSNLCSVLDRALKRLRLTNTIERFQTARHRSREEPLAGCTAR